MASRASPAACGAGCGAFSTFAHAIRPALSTLPPCSKATSTPLPALTPVAQSHPQSAQLPLQHTILLLEELDHVALLAFEPAEQRREDQMERNHLRSPCRNSWMQLPDTTAAVKAKVTIFAIVYRWLPDAA